MMKKKIWIAAGIIALVLIMTGITVYRQAFAKGPQVATELVKMEEISSTLMIPGTLKMQDEQKVYISPEDGKVKEILVQEGKQVHAGDTLATLENDQLQLEIEQNKLSIESGNLRINQIKNQISNLKEKQTTLAKEIGEKEAKEQLKSDFDQLEMEKKMADLELRQTLLQKETLEGRKGKLNLTSKIDGTVLTLNQASAESSSLASTGGQEPFLIIGNLGTLVAEGTLSEYDTLKVAAGQKVTLTSDAVPGQAWDGEIIKIGSLPKDGGLNVQGDNQAVQYPVTVKVTSEQIPVKPGFQIIMEIRTETKNGLVIPAEALLNEEEKSFVYILDGNIARKTEVEVGLMAGENIEVINGLKEKDEVIIGNLDKITDGLEVSKK
jgi:HlyD family secretion protein